MKLYCTLPGDPAYGQVYQCPDCGQWWIWRYADHSATQHDPGYCTYQTISPLRVWLFHHAAWKHIRKTRKQKCLEGDRY